MSTKFPFPEIKGKPALLIIDMQNGCVGRKDDKNIYPCRRTVIDNINKLAQHFRRHGYPVIYPVIEHEANGSTLPVEHSEVWSVKGSEDAEVLEEIQPKDGDITVPKIRLSAFFKTDLESTLKRLGINTVVLTGYQLSICVLATALDSFQLGFSCRVVMDATLDISERRFNDFSRFFTECQYSLSTDQVIDNIRGGC